MAASAESGDLELPAVQTRDVVVIGTSAGGVQALKQLFAELPAELPAAVLCVLHMDAFSSGLLATLLQSEGGLAVQNARDGEPYRAGNAYLAVPDHHLVVDGEVLRLTRAPRENRCRPAVDTLFRSAAVSLGSRVIGIVLTGNLDDGTAGLQAVKSAGGIAWAQDPEDADFPGMPESALQYVDVDDVIQLNDLGARIVDAVGMPAAPAQPLPNDVILEADIALRGFSDIDRNQVLGDHSSFSCPECGGPMWLSADNEDFPRYRCHTGHAYTARTLSAGLETAAEESLWVALRTLEERTRMLDRLAARAEKRENPQSAETMTKRADEARKHVRVLREFMGSLGG